MDINLYRTTRSCLPEKGAETIDLQVSDLSMNTVSRALMQEFVKISYLHVDQHFNYRGFHRFDPAIDIADITDLSQQSRKHEHAAHFASEFSKSNYLKKKSC